MMAASVSAMADEMPCCPQEKPARPDCQKTCPLMAICMAKCSLNAPIISARAFILAKAADKIMPRDDWSRDGFGEVPPIRPPRI
jgi:hypothetical protein